jgi:hypothetical protein
MLPDVLALKSLFDVFLKNKVIEYCLIADKSK